MKRQIILIIILLIILSLCINAQDNIHASFSGRFKKIEIVISNISEMSEFNMPNTIRMGNLSPDMIQTDGDTIVLSFFHYTGTPLVISQGNDINITRAGVLAYEFINPGSQKKYQFKLPCGYRNTKKFYWLILNFNDARKFVLKRE